MRRGFDNRLWALYLLCLGASIALFVLVTFDAAGGTGLVAAVLLGVAGFAFAGAALKKGGGRSG